MAMVMMADAVSTCQGGGRDGVVAFDTIAIVGVVVVVVPHSLIVDKR
jgi:hypothetical protein